GDVAQHAGGRHFHAALVRGVHAAEDAHQRRFAGAVLANESVNLARGDLERRAAIGPHGAERLVNVREPDGGDRARVARGRGGAHRDAGTRMRPAMISRRSSSTRARTLSGMSARLFASYT